MLAEKPFAYLESEDPNGEFMGVLPDVELMQLF
jgi:hypothetical protein